MHVCKEGTRASQNIYCPDIHSFNYLFPLIKDMIKPENVLKARNASGSEVCSEMFLAIAMRYIASGSV